MRVQFPYIFSILLFCGIWAGAFAQQNKIDSLKQVVRTAGQDTVKVNALNELCKLVGSQEENYDSALVYANQAKILAQKINYKKGIATSLKQIGWVSRHQSKYHKALKEFSVALKLFEEVGDKKGIAACHHNLGDINWYLGNYPESLKEYYASLKIDEEIVNKSGIALTYLKLANVFSDQGNYTDALNKYHAALNIFESLGDKRGISSTQNNIGNIYYEQGNYNEALNEYLASLKIKTEIGDKKGIANSQTNIGSIYYQQGKYPAALKEQFASLKTNEEIRDKQGIAAAHNNIGNVYLKMHNPKESRVEQKKALLLSKEIGHKETIKDSYWGLVKADSALGDNKSALENYKMYIVYRDSLINEENTKKTVKAQMNYDFEKKEAATKAEQDMKDQKAEEEKNKQKLITLSIGAGLLLMLVISFIIFRSLYITRKQKKVIEAQKSEVEHQKLVIEEKNKDITDSINYAKLIQNAMLPRLEDIHAAFADSFVLYRPKDIVSGDFYFFYKHGALPVIAAADCTGHGVPGGFMSMVGAERLTDAAQQADNPAQILSLLNRGVKRSLKQGEGQQSTYDGMDIALCQVDTDKRILRYAGANRPLWIIRKGSAQVEEVKATKKAIGGFTGDEQSFDMHEIGLSKGDAFYLLSDGYPDLFGGNGKKLTTRKLKQLLLDISGMSMKEQGAHLDEFASQWTGNTEQLDDILVIGIRL